MRQKMPTSGRQSKTKGKLQVSYYQSVPSLYSSPYSDSDSDRFLSKHKSPMGRASPDRSRNLTPNDFKTEGNCKVTIKYGK